MYILNILVNRKEWCIKANKPYIKPYLSLPQLQLVWNLMIQTQRKQSKYFSAGRVKRVSKKKLKN